MKKILITGGSGFIGSHLSERLLKKKYHVLSLDNFFSSSKSNINHLFKYENFEFIRHDITFPFYAEVDEIYNLACPASPVHYQRDPVQTTKVNVLGSINMLGLAKRTSSKIFQASTSEIYGDPMVSPQVENYWGNVNPIGLRSCYDEGKRVSETLFMDYHRQHKVNIKIARILNTHGPNMAIDDGRVISNFIVQCLQNKPITIYGDGNQTRSFCYIEDLVDGIMALMSSSKKITGPINLGNPLEMKIKEIALKIKELTNSKSKIVYKNLPSDDPTRRKPNIALAKKNLKWKPKVSLNQGLLETINYFEEKIKKST